MEELILKVEGMTCEGCEGRIRAALADLPGVRTSIAAHRSGEVRVSVDPTQTATADVRAAIEQIGYKVAG